LAAACGAADETAPPYAPTACPRLETHLPRLRQALAEGRVPGLRRALSEGLGEHEAGRLVGLVAAGVRALPDGRLGGLVGEGARVAVVELGPAAAAGLGALASSPDVEALGPALGATLDRCGTGPLLEAVAELLRAAELPGLVAAAHAVAADEETVQVVRDSLFSSPEQRPGFVATVLPIVCLTARPEVDLAPVLEAFEPFVGERLSQPPLSTLVDAVLAALAPATPVRHALAPWAACATGRPAGTEAFSCPLPLPAPAPDPDVVLLGALWEVLASDAVRAWALAAGSESGLAAPAWTAELSGVLRSLAADPQAEAAWAELVAALLAPDRARGLLEDLSTLLGEGAGLELLAALRALEDGCPP